MKVALQEFRSYIHNIYIRLMIRAAEPEFPLGGYKKILITCNTCPINIFPTEKSILVFQKMPACMNFSPFFLLLHLKVNQGLQGVFLSKINPKFSVRISMHKAEMCRDSMRKPIIEHFPGFCESVLK